MSHLEERNATRFVIGQRPTGFWFGDEFYGGPTEDYEERVNGRAASTRNPKNSWGWRSPADYFGYEGTARPGWVEYRWAGGIRFKAILPAHAITAYDYPSSWRDGPYQRALLKFKHRNLNLAVSVGEIRETRRMLRDTILALVEMAHAIKTGNVRTMARTARRGLRPVDLWLQARYGWLPLLSDMKGAVDSLQQRLTHPAKGDGITARARHIVGERVEKDFDIDLYGGWLKCTEVTERGFICRVRLDATVIDTHFRDLVDTGIQDPLLVAWNLLGGSFVFDWVVGVGKYLDGLNALAGLHYLGGSESIRYVINRYYENPSFPTGELISFTSPRLRLKRFDRSTVAVPDSRLVMKGFDGMNNVRWADAAALLYKALKKFV